MNKKEIHIVLTGGGTAGHVMPHLAMISEYVRRGWKLDYIGSSGIEKELIKDPQIKFHQIQAGKLRRYFSFENFIDVFRIMIGFIQSLILLVSIRPNIIFSKGGFVSVPVAMAGWLLRIPVISHESDVTPGLANRIIARFARRILFSFPDTKNHLPSEISIFAGIPIRPELLTGNRIEGLKLCCFADSDEMPVILIMGGSSGAQKINQALLEALPELVKKLRVIHITGKGKSIDFSHRNYKSFEYIGNELKDIYAASDMIVSRAGANSIFEFLSLKKPMLLIPLEAGSRGDQVDNAKCFLARGWAIVLREGHLSGNTLIESITALEIEKEKIINAQRSSYSKNSSEVIFSVLEDVMRIRFNSKE
ncbi:MAG: undecaprenyldiphospho-muramoylpentapeptide beta-N-acetylglucosaminyltransferase [Oligoflexales bacterium]|nr:undecaprenyldiphospho-muramoylpentapeptide beta-N-acetylglucosaminyltransferase [Oligoflexales bacterium]